MNFDFKLKPGQNIEKSKYINTAKTISVIMPVLQNYSNIKKYYLQCFKYDYENIYDNLDVHIPKKIIDNKINILMIVPWMIIGGADIFNLELIKRS